MTTDVMRFSVTSTLTMKTICSNLSHRTFRVWSLIRAIVEEKESTDIWIKQSQIAEMIHMSVETLARGIRELVEKGYLVLKKNYRQGRYRRYERKKEGASPCPLPAERGEGIRPNDTGGIPKELVDAVAHIKKTLTSLKDRGEAITNTVAQFLTAAVVDDGEPLSFVTPPKLPPAILTPQSENITDLEAQIHKLCDEQKTGFGMKAYDIQLRVNMLKKREKERKAREPEIPLPILAR